MDLKNVSQYGLYFLALLELAQGQFFCEQFFVDIRSKTSHNFTVNDTAAAGHVVRRFPNRPSLPEHTILLTYPEQSYVRMDYSNFALVVSQSLRPLNGEVIEVNGTCIDLIQPIMVTYSVDVTFYINVHDVNDPPLFTNLPASVSLYENTTVGAVIFTVETDSSYDLSEDYKRHTLSIGDITALETSRPSPGRTFYINDAGEIHLLQELDYEQGPRVFKLKLVAKDYGDPPMTNESYLTIHVRDVDDMSPEFTNATYYLQVIGEKPLDGREECFDASPPIFAEDQDRGVKSQVEYSIIAGEPGHRDYWSQFFRIDPRLGLVCQRETIQRLLRDADTGRDIFFNFTFTIKAEQVDNPHKSDTSRLHIHVVDDNRFAPTFERRLYRAELQEYPATAAGAHVTRVTAVDRDHGLNAAFAYELTVNPEGAFAVDAAGRITVIRPGAIDRERNKTFTIKVRARETESVDGRQGEARVVVSILDINDHAPLFNKSEYRYEIKDTLLTGRPIHSINGMPRAYDKDPGDNGEVTYKITSAQRVGGRMTLPDYARFSVETNTGIIQLAGSLRDLRRKREYPMFHLLITATDRAKEREKLSTSINVYIRVIHANDYAPQFISDVSGDVDIAGHSPAPIISKTFSVNEDAVLGTVAAKLPASDEDGDIDVFLSYDIIDPEREDMFYISSKGWLTLKKPLDRELKDIYNLEVQVTDGYHNASTNVTIIVNDANDNAPVFNQSEYVFYVQEEPDLGTFVGTVAGSDVDLGDAGVVNYIIKSGKGADDFSVREDGTIIVWKLSPLLDREQNEKIEFKIAAYDSGDPKQESTAEVTIYLHDVNDNRPQFEAPFYTGTVEEDDNNPRPQLVVMEVPIRSVDKDAERMNRDVRYSLGGRASDKFKIDPVGGAISVKDQGTIDCETLCYYELQVIVTDQAGVGLSSSVDLTINVRDTNDNPPTFGVPETFDLDGSTNVGFKVGKVEANDNDVSEPNNRLIYILKSGGFGKFSVEYETGDIMVSDTLAREPFVPEYQLLIQALDGGTPRLVNNTIVTIKVPVNRPPEIDLTSAEMYVDEEVDNGTLVGRINVTDIDNLQPDVDNKINQIPGGVSESVTSYRQSHQFYTHSSAVPFKIHRSSGEILTNGRIDRERDEYYKFLVFVEDTGHPPMTSNVTVTVHVRDVNDHPPQFYLSHYQGSVIEDDTVPVSRQQVNLNVNVTAEDWDVTPENRGINLSLHGPQASWFKIFPGGTVAVSSYGRGRLDREKHPVYKLKVRATDQDGDGLWSEADLSIRVLDINDNVPIFRVLPHEILLDENVQVGQNIGRLLAHDKDATTPNYDIIYALESDSYGKFRVDLRTGVITVLRGLFFQPRQPTYILRVVATDMGSPPQSKVASVTIKVNKENFNDFKPEIQGETVFYVKEEVEVGTLVGKLDVVDEDLGDDEVIMVIHSESHVPFSIDTQTGEVYTAGRLDYDTGLRAYTFSVIARDTGDPPKEARIYVGVILEDVNDNPPRFAQAVYRHRVTPNFPPGTVIATPFAFDELDSLRGTYTYSLEGPGGFLTISTMDGVIKATEALVGVTNPVLEYTVVAVDRENPELKAVARLVIDVDHGSEMPMCS